MKDRDAWVTAVHRAIMETVNDARKLDKPVLPGFMGNAGNGRPMGIFIATGVIHAPASGRGLL